MSAIATAVVGGAVVGGIGSAISAKSASDAQNRANDTNLRIAQQTNDLNKQMFDESRGSTGSSVLPLYLKAYESSLANGAANSAQSLSTYGGGTGGRLQTAAGTIGGYMPLVSAGNDYLASLYNGNLLGQRRAAYAPVADARIQAAKDAASAIDQSIYGNIGQINSEAASRGFLGGNTFDRNRVLMATVGAKLAASQQLANARLQNAQDTYGLNESDVAMRQQNLDQPFTRANQSLALQYAPIDNEARTASNAMNPLSFFRIGANAFQYQRPNPVTPVLGSGAMLGGAMQGIGSAISSFGTGMGMAKMLTGPGTGTPGGTVQPGWTPGGTEGGYTSPGPW